MIKKTLLLILFLALTFGISNAEEYIGNASDISADFNFVTRDGVATSLYGEVTKLPPSVTVTLLLFDPDCDHCRELIGSLLADDALLNDIKSGSEALILVYPVAEQPEADDPNYQLYQRLCNQLPSNWIIGIDNGSLFDTDAITWEQLPVMMRFQSRESGKWRGKGGESLPGE